VMEAAADVPAPPGPESDLNERIQCGEMQCLRS
jgi:hypothetical protein